METNITVTFKKSERVVKAEVEIAAHPVSLRLPSGIAKSRTLASRLETLVETADDPDRSVLIEMLRQVVLGNYGGIDGRRGENAQMVLEKVYPSRGALPGFRRSNWDNAAGMFIRNALLDAAGDLSYARMAGLVLRMIEAGWMDPPEIEVPRLPQAKQLSMEEARALVSATGGVPGT